MSEQGPGPSPEDMSGQREQDAPEEDVLQIKEDILGEDDDEPTDQEPQPMNPAEREDVPPKEDDDITEQATKEQGEISPAYKENPES